MTEIRYFDGRGAAECTRLLFAAAGKSNELTDTRYVFDMSKREQGMEVACPDLHAAKLAGEHTMNLDRCPVMKVGDTWVGQSPAMERYVARQMGLFGADELEGCKIDCICENLHDIKQKAGDAKKAGDEANAKFWDEDLKGWLEKLEKCLDGSGFAIGNKLSLADCKLFMYTQESVKPNMFNPNDNTAKMEAALANCPKIKASAAAFAANADVASHIAARKQTPF